MKYAALTLLLAAALASAQTSYTQQYPVGGGADITSRFANMDTPFNDGLYLNQIAAYPGNPTHPAPYGWMCYSLGGVTNPCVNVTDLVWGTNVTNQKCTGPGTVHIVFDGGTYDATLQPYLGGAGRTYGCYRRILSATITLQ